MATQEKPHSLDYPYALYVDETGQETRVFLPNSTITPDKRYASEIYNANKHKGKLCCPDCKIAKIHLIDPQYMAQGDTVKRKPYWAKYGSKDHPETCAYNKNSEQENKKKKVQNADGQIIYLNMSYRNAARTLISCAPPNTELPEHIRRVKRSLNSAGFYSLATEGLANMPSRPPIHNIHDLLHVFKNYSEDDLQKTWVIHGAVAIRLEQMIIRKKKDGVLPNITFNDQANAFNKTDASFVRHLNDARHGVKHPVIIHFIVEQPPTIADADLLQQKLQIKLADYLVTNPSYTPNSSLKGVTIGRKVERSVEMDISEALHLGDIKVGDEFLCIAESELTGNDGHYNEDYHQTFTVLNSSAITRIALKDLQALIKKKPKKQQEQRPPVILDIPTSIPA